MSSIGVNTKDANAPLNAPQTTRVSMGSVRSLFSVYLLGRMNFRARVWAILYWVDVSTFFSAVYFEEQLTPKNRAEFSAAAPMSGGEIPLYSPRIPSCATL